MEISLVGDELNRFHHPTLLARLFRLSSNLSGVWAWSAIVLAVLAFSGLVRRAKLRHRRVSRNPVLPHPTFQYDDSDSSSDDGDGDNDEEEDDTDEEDECSEPVAASENCGPFWPEIGGAVVKAWDGLGLGRSGSCGSINLFDLSRGEVLKSFALAAAHIPVFEFASPAVVLSASGSTVKVWDARDGGGSSGEWRPPLRRRVVGVEGGDGGRVYVTDDAGEVAELDLRGARSPAATAWWDAGKGGDESVVSWCRNAAKCLTLLPLPE